MACRIFPYHDAVDNTRDHLVESNVMDRYGNIKDYGEFIRISNLLTEGARNVYGLPGSYGRLWYADDMNNAKALPNFAALKWIDNKRKELGVYETRSSPPVIRNEYASWRPPVDIRKNYFNRPEVPMVEILDRVAKVSPKHAQLVNFIKKSSSKKDLATPFKITDDYIRHNYDWISEDVIMSTQYPVKNGNAEELILHEALHVITHKKLRDPLLADEVEKLSKIRERAKEYLGDIYEVSNNDEFIVAMYTNEDFIISLSGIPSELPGMSLLDEVIEWIINLLNIKKDSNAYTQAANIATSIVNSDSLLIPANYSGDFLGAQPYKSLNESLIDFARKLNPNFRIEIVEDLVERRGVNAVARIKDFVIELQEGNESALPEEIAHFFIELLPDDHPVKKKILDEVTRTRLYKDVRTSPGYKAQYGSDTERFKREAAAQLVALYLTDKQAFNYWSGSDSLIDNMSRIIKEFLAWIRGKGNEISEIALVAEKILNADTSDLLTELSYKRDEMFSIRDKSNEEVSELAKMQSLRGKDLRAYDKIFININDTILDYQGYNKKKIDKRKMFFDDKMLAERNEYFLKAKLTKLGRELRDKIDLIGPEKITFYTQLPVTNALVERLMDEFGNVNIVRVTDSMFIEMPDGTFREKKGKNTQDYAKYVIEKQKGLNAAARIVFINDKPLSNMGEQTFESIGYDDSFAPSYVNTDTIIRMRREREANDAKARTFENEMKTIEKVLGKESLTEKINIAVKNIRSQFQKIEDLHKRLGDEELSNIFRDDAGNINLPVNRVRVAERLFKEYMEGKIDNHGRAVMEFVASIEATTAFFSHANKNIIDNIAPLLEDPNEVDNAIQKLSQLYYFSTIWEAYIKNVQESIASLPNVDNTRMLFDRFLGEIESTKRITLGMSKKAVALRLMKYFDGYNSNVMALIEDRKRMLDSVGENRKAELLDEIEELKESIVTEDKLVNQFMGRDGDISKLTPWVKTLINSGDMTLSGLAQYLNDGEMNADNEAIRNLQRLGGEIMDIMKKNNLTNKDIEDLIYIDTEWHKNENGETKDRDAKYLLNPYKHLTKFRVKKNLVAKAYDDFRKENRPEEKERLRLEYLRVKKDFENWTRANYHDEYTDKFYSRYDKLVSTPEALELFEDVKEMQSEIWGEINNYREQLFVETEPGNIEVLNRAIQDKVTELRMLRNSYYPDGTKKVGRDLAIAEMLQKKTEIDREVYEWKVDTPGFYGDFMLLVGATNMSEDVRNRLVYYLDFGMASDETDFTELLEYAKYNAPHEVVRFLESNLKVKYSDSWYEYRNGLIEKLNALLPDDTSVRDIWDKITNLTSYLRDEDGILDGSSTTPELQKLVMKLETTLEDIKSNKSNELDDDTRDEVIEIITELNETQSKDVTPYYVENFITLARNSGFADEYEKIVGVRIDYGVNVMDLINSPDFKKFMGAYKDTYPGFINWFVNNHFLKESRDEFGDKTQMLTPTYIWRKIEPISKFDILSIPGSKYSKRVVKDEFITKKIDGVNWDPLMMRWLPKSAEFRNEKYYELMAKTDARSMALKEILKRISEIHLFGQVDAPYEGRIGFRLPAVEKTEFEGNFFTNAWKSFTDERNRFEKGEGNYDDLSQEKKGLMSFLSDKFKSKKRAIRADSLGNQVQKVAVPYSGYLKPEDVTNDILLSVARYHGGIMNAKAKRNSLSLFRLLDGVLESNQPIDMRDAQGKVKSKSNARLESLRFLMNNKIYGVNKQYELGVGIDRGLNMVRQFNTFGSLGTLTGFATNIKNNLQARLQNFINAEFVNWSDSKSMTKAAMNMKTNWFMFHAESEKPMNKRSKEWHLMMFFNPELGNRIFEDVYGGSMKRNFKQDAWFIQSRVMEFGINTNVLFSHLYYKDVVNEKGEKKKLYDVLYYDGGVKVMPGYYEDLGFGQRGREINEEFLMRTKQKFRSVLEYTQGKITNKTLLSTYTIGQAALYFKGWLIPMLRRRFDTRKANYALESDIEGYWITFYKMSYGMIMNILRDGELYWNTYTPMEKANYIAAVKEIGVMFASMLIISLLFGFDIDDEDKFKKLKNNSYLENTALLIALQTKGETESLAGFPGFFTTEGQMTPPVITEGWRIVKNPWIGLSMIENTRKVVDATYLLALDNMGIDSPEAYYDRNMPAFNIDKGDAKAKHYLFKTLQIDDLLYFANNPEGKVQSYISNIRR